MATPKSERDLNISFQQQLNAHAKELGFTPLTVDGQWGLATQAAWLKAVKAGYANKKNRLVKKSSTGAQTPRTVSTQNKAAAKSSLPTLLTNMDAIIKNISKLKGRYTVVDKQNNMIYLYENGKLIAKDKVTLGSFKGDGYTITKNEKNWKDKARLTGAGVFTVRSSGRMYDETDKSGKVLVPHWGVRLKDSSGNSVTEALHRSTNMGSGKAGDRYSKSGGSGGCVRSDLADKMAQKGWYLAGDTVIVVPEMKGNTVYFDDKSQTFKTKFTNMPTSVQHTGGYNKVLLQYNQTPTETTSSDGFVWYNPTTWFN